MFKKLLVLAVTLLILAIGYISMPVAAGQNYQLQPVQTSELSLEERSEFSQLVRDYLTAWSPGSKKFDISVPERFYSKGSDFTAYDVMPPVEGFVGWENYKAKVTPIMNGYSDFNITPNEDLRVFRRGNIAWTTISFKAKGALKSGQPIDSVGRVSLIWEWQNGQWLIVHEHSSVLLTSN